MKYHLFLHYGWFLQNLGKEAVRTNMHTTVVIQSTRPQIEFSILITFLKSVQYSKKNEEFVYELVCLPDS